MSDAATVCDHATPKESGKNSPDEENIASYTDGNMADIIEDKEAAMKREKQEFMYQFEGAMSVIQETEEPDDEITVKNSSSMMLMRENQIETPKDRMSKEPVPQKPTSNYQMISPNNLFQTSSKP